MFFSSLFKNKYLNKYTFLSAVHPPRDITVGRPEATSFDIRWSKAPGMEDVPHHFIMTCTSPGTDSLAIHTEVCHTTLTDLQPDKQYTVGISAVMNNGRQSEPVSTTIDTSKMHNTHFTDLKMYLWKHVHIVWVLMKLYFFIRYPCTCQDDSSLSGHHIGHC